VTKQKFKDKRKVAAVHKQREVLKGWGGAGSTRGSGSNLCGKQHATLQAQLVPLNDHSTLSRAALRD